MKFDYIGKTLEFSTLNCKDRDAWFEALNNIKSEIKQGSYRKISLLSASPLAENITKLSDRSNIGLISYNSNIGDPNNNNEKKLISGFELNNNINNNKEKKHWKEQMFSKELMKVNFFFIFENYGITQLVN